MITVNTVNTYTVNTWEHGNNNQRNDNYKNFFNKSNDYYLFHLLLRGVP